MPQPFLFTFILGFLLWLYFYPGHFMFSSLVQKCLLSWETSCACTFFGSCTVHKLARSDLTSIFFGRINLYPYIFSFHHFAQKCLLLWETGRLHTYFGSCAFVLGLHKFVPRTFLVFINLPKNASFYDKSLCGIIVVWVGGLHQ
jgi:hypothetical protein